MAGDHVPREKDAKKGRNAAAITTVILSDMLSPNSAALFLRRRANVAPRIDFLLFDVRHSADRGLVGLLGIFLEGPFLLDLGFFFFAHALEAPKHAALAHGT